MGQYFKIVCLDRKEYIHPHSLEKGAKLWEICADNIGGLLVFLLRKSSETGGGDIQKEYKYAGRWAGCKVLVVGDYDESGLYDEACEEKGWKDISKEIAEEFDDFIEIDELKILKRPR